MTEPSAGVAVLAVRALYPDAHRLAEKVIVPHESASHPPTSRRKSA